MPATKSWINAGAVALPTNWSAFAKERGGKHVLTCAWFRPDGGWTEEPAAIFYAPGQPGYSNRYFGLLGGPLGVVVFDADRVEELRFLGLKKLATGEIIFSRWRHDFRGFSDGGACVDGGLDYFRAIGPFEGTEGCYVGVRDGVLVEIV